MERAGSTLLRRLKRRDALRRQQEAHCDVITGQLQQREYTTYQKINRERPNAKGYGSRCVDMSIFVLIVTTEREDAIYKIRSFYPEVLSAPPDNSAVQFDSSNDYVHKHDRLMSGFFTSIKNSAGYAGSGEDRGAGGELIKYNYIFFLSKNNQLFLFLFALFGGG